MNQPDLSDVSLDELFRLEAEGQAQVLTAGLLALEREPAAAEQLESCMRAAHSLKGAARIVERPVAVQIAHVMEDVFVAAQQGRITLRQASIDTLLRGVDLLAKIARVAAGDAAHADAAMQPEVDLIVSDLQSIAAAMVGPAEPASQIGETLLSDPALSSRPSTTAAPESASSGPPGEGLPTVGNSPDRVLRVSAANLNRLLALASESRVESRWLRPFAESLLRLKRQQYDLIRTLETLRNAVPEALLDEVARSAQAEALRRAIESHQQLSQRLVELDGFDRRAVNLSHRLYAEALAVRMRPLGDAVQGFPRMVRDLGRALGKSVNFEIVGETTEVDRDILAQLEAPLGHLLRNAVDHGIDAPAERAAAGKPAEGLVRLDARHSAGMLQITVSDDGRGIDLERLRAAIVARSLTTADTAGALSESELLEFLFLPGFTLRDAVTEISGRGVGLDAVQTMIKAVRGTVRVTSRLGQGTQFQLQLPLTLSVVRTLLVSIGGEPYAFPLAYIRRTLKLPAASLGSLEGRQHFDFDGHPIGLVSAQEVIGAPGGPAADLLSVVVVGAPGATYGLVVDRFLGERELMVQPLDPRLGKIKDIAAAGMMEDGSPVLIVDIDDLVRSVERLVSSGRLKQVEGGAAGAAKKSTQRVLVVDDSLTVRELERKVLQARGYVVEAAVDGMDGWNAARSGHFQLVITDVDMPRLDGIELVKLIKRDARLKSLPVMIVSYKDRAEDRQRGLEAGADYYLTKGSFHDETLVQAVIDLIGEAES